MESENKYLKQIRDELKKKNGDTSHSLYNEPNTKAKYLRDIAKEIHKFDGGGTAPTGIVHVVTIDEDYEGELETNQVALTMSVLEIVAALEAGDMVVFKHPSSMFNYYFYLKSFDGSNSAFNYRAVQFRRYPDNLVFHDDSITFQTEELEGRIEGSGGEFVDTNVFTHYWGDFHYSAPTSPNHELHGAITSNAESNNGVVSNSINGTYTVVEDGGES